MAFEHVSYRYQAGQVALSDVSFVVPAGAMAALVGPTGAGKTTALGLLYRAHDPSDGRITLDGIDIRTVDLNSLRENIGVVFQDPGLFYRSIADNLRIGKPDAGAVELEAAARAAQAHDFIVVKPEGYSTLVAERGRSLSGGERQRVSIAHRLSTVRNADLILVLDGGRLVEQGKYDELLRRDGLFAQLDRQGRFKADADSRLDKSL